MKYLALLRGINVGGNNLVRMQDLRLCFEGLGFTDVTTYIQSGNVLFESRVRSTGKLSATIEAALAEKLRCPALVVVVTEEQLARVVDDAPPEFGAFPEEYRYDVVFVKAPLQAKDALPAIKLKDGVDDAWERHGVLYFRRVKARASQSYLSKIVQHAAYPSMTIRNWNTASELHRLITAKRA